MSRKPSPAPGTPRPPRASRASMPVHTSTPAHTPGPSATDPSTSAPTPASTHALDYIVDEGLGYDWEELKEDFASACTAFHDINVAHVTAAALLRQVITNCDRIILAVPDPTREFYNGRLPQAAFAVPAAPGYAGTEREFSPAPIEYTTPPPFHISSPTAFPKSLAPTVPVTIPSAFGTLHGTAQLLFGELLSVDPTLAHGGQSRDPDWWYTSALATFERAKRHFPSAGLNWQLELGCGLALARTAEERLKHPDGNPSAATTEAERLLKQAVGHFTSATSNMPATPSSASWLQLLPSSPPVTTLPFYLRHEFSRARIAMAVQRVASLFPPAPLNLRIVSPYDRDNEARAMGESGLAYDHLNVVAKRAQGKNTKRAVLNTPGGRWTHWAARAWDELGRQGEPRPFWKYLAMRGRGECALIDAVESARRFNALREKLVTTRRPAVWNIDEILDFRDAGAEAIETLTEACHLMRFAEDCPQNPGFILSREELYDVLAHAYRTQAQMTKDEALRDELLDEARELVNRQDAEVEPQNLEQLVPEREGDAE